MIKGDAYDPKGLIGDAYKIEGIGLEECRTIFLDWALSMPLGTDTEEAMRILLKRHAVEGHPMNDVLNEGLAKAAKIGRRGGRAARVGGAD